MKVKCAWITCINNKNDYCNKEEINLTDSSIINDYLDEELLNCTDYECDQRPFLEKISQD